MQASELKKQLHEDAAQDVPPFAADSLKLARHMGETAGPILLELINARSDASFWALEALREVAPEAYHSLSARLRAEIYGKALRVSSFYNTWGAPGLQLTDTAKAFIDLGEEAVIVLKPLMTDRRTAPLSGSHEATTSEVYGNRVCDYAWVFINEIRQQPYGYSLNPIERDEAIDALRQAV